MSTSDPTVYALLTALSGLGVALVVIPVLRLMVSPWLPLRMRQPSRPVRAAVGGLGVLLSVTFLVPMGGDGIAVALDDPRLALGVVVAGALLVLGLTEGFRTLEARQRLWVLAAFAMTASSIGFQPAGVRPDLLAWLCGTVALLVGMHLFRGFGSLPGLAPGTAALSAGFLAVLSRDLGVLQWGDLQLGLCGALLGLLVWSLGRGPWQTGLGESGGLAVGFLMAATLLRISEHATPAMRPYLLLPLAFPLADLAWVAAWRHLQGWPLLRRRRDHLHERLLDFGMPARHTLVLCWLLQALAGLLCLRSLGLLG